MTFSPQTHSANALCQKCVSPGTEELVACHHQATQAYLGGDKALAKELGAKGRWHAQQMAAAHSKASDAIFRARNPAAKGTHLC